MRSRAPEHFSCGVPIAPQNPPASPPAQSAQAEQPKAPLNVVPAPANQPEPNEKVGVITSFAPLVKRVMPTVVNVAVVQDVKVGAMQGEPEEGGGGPEEGGPEAGPENGPPGMPPGGGGGGDPFEQFRRFFGQMPHDYKQHGLGSGVIVSPDGYILTNYHVVGGAEDIHVTLMDKREFTAKVIGKDAKTDLALIKIDTKDPLPVAELGDSDAAEMSATGSSRSAIRSASPLPPPPASSAPKGACSAEQLRRLHPD